MNKKMTIIISILLIAISISVEFLTPERDFKSFITGILLGLGIGLFLKAILRMKADS